MSMENFLEKNYEKNMEMLALAYSYCKSDFDHEILIAELYKNDDLKKQLCLIEIKKINSQQEADAIVFNLTGKSGPIREAASYIILELIQNPEYKNFFQTKDIANTFVKAVIDINPTVSRNIVRSIYFVDDVDYLYKQIILQTKNTLSEMKSIKQNRSYNTNKQNFSLYWNLEALINISDKIKPDEKLLNILKITAQSNDYTIREKTAKLAKELSLKYDEYLSVIKLLENDTNIYVKKYF